MNLLVYFYYPILAFILLFGMKIAPKGSFHDGFLSLTQTKALQGFAAICVVFHHIAQNTCAPWLARDIIIHGLEPFVPIGYLMVALFFFCSGYGLLKSYKTKENYLKDFFIRRALRPVVILAITDAILLFLMAFFPEKFFENATILIPTPFNMGGAILLNEYSWFIYALLIMYVAFWLSFRVFSKRRIAILFVCIATLGYIAFCDWWMYGNWWYNSILLFPIGLLFAEYEGKIIPFIQKKYRLMLLVTLILFPLCFFGGEYFPYLRGALFIPYQYFTEHWLILIAQILAAVSFLFLLILVGMKVQLGNKILSFLGTITAELYLIHILFLKMIGTPADDVKFWTIQNLAIYIFVILLLSITTSYLLYLLGRLIVFLVSKKPAILKLLKKDFFVLTLIAIGFLVFTVICIRNESQAFSDEWSDDLEAYRNDNITYADVDGLKMAAYVMGKGEHTVVLLGGSQDLFSTIGLRPLANRLAESNHVVVLDYFGCGFSDTTPYERTVERYVYEIRTALASLGETGPYILMPNEISGLYALFYANEYPDEVEAIIALDTLVAAQQEDVLTQLNLTPDAYCTRLQRERFVCRYLNEFARFTGLNRTTWFITEHHFKYSQSENTLPLLAELYHIHTGNANQLDAYALRYQNHQRLAGLTYPSDLPVLSLLGSQSVEGKYYPESDWRALHESLISNPEIQEIKEIPGNPYFAFSLPKPIAEEAGIFIERLNTEKK